MRRALTCLVGTALAALLLLAAATAVAKQPPVDPEKGYDVRGPACADIIVDNVDPETNEGTTSVAVYMKGAETAAFRAVLAEPSCPQATYTFTVYDEPGDEQPLATVSQRGDGASAVLLFLGLDVSANGAEDTVICAVATTSIGRHVFDRSPDEAGECIPIDAASGPANRWR